MRDSWKTMNKGRTRRQREPNRTCSNVLDGLYAKIRRNPSARGSSHRIPWNKKKKICIRGAYGWANRISSVERRSGRYTTHMHTHRIQWAYERAISCSFASFDRLFSKDTQHGTCDGSIGYNELFEHTTDLIGYTNFSFLHSAIFVRQWLPSHTPHYRICKRWRRR